MTLYIVTSILIVSIALAFRSMKNLGIPKDVQRVFGTKGIKGAIVFFKDKIVHYSSKSS